MKKGVAVSPGIAIARAFRIEDTFARHDPLFLLDDADVAAEVARLDGAVAAVASELDRTVDRVNREVGEDAAAIFRAHRLLLRDPVLLGKVRALVTGRRVDARTALQDTLDEYTALFGKIADEYLRERLADLRDVVGQVITHLSARDQAAQIPLAEKVVLIAAEILPSQAVMFERLPVAGIATEAGGTTGHAAILARSLSIPAVSGLRGLLAEVRTGDMVILDGRDGTLIINPGPEAEAAYRKARREFRDLRDKLIENRDHPAVTRDGTTIDLLANVNTLSDAAATVQVGAVGVGLYRTEYLFLTHATVPNEEEQYAAYRAIVEASPPEGGVTIRTLDLGGDKQVAYLGDHREANPFMGWRSIRLASAYPEFFQTQLRAVLRAAAHGPVKLLFPMVSTIEEVVRIKATLNRMKLALTRAGVRFAADVPVGVMIEVPSAAVCIDLMLDEVDFVSIGSNDLTQYLMAADRDNPKVAHLCEPFHPAIYRLLRSVIGACVDRGKSVTLCGEMAARPRCVLALLGMGLRRLSMSPAFVPPVKELVRSLNMPDAVAAADELRAARTAAEVVELLTRRLRQVNPSLALLDAVS